MPNRPTDAMLEDTVTVGSVPGGAGGASPERPGTQIDIKAAASKQYTAVSRLAWWGNYPRSLSHAIDDTTTDFGADLYSKMLLDSQVRAMTNVLIGSILEDGIKLSPAIEDKEEDGY